MKNSNKLEKKTGIYNGFPVTYNRQFDSFDTDLLITKFLPNSKRRECIEWVKEKYTKAKTIHKYCSYELKHHLERDTGIYLTDNQFKHLMLICGHKPVDETEFQWRFRIKYK